jgi:hypothetical protein
MKDLKNNQIELPINLTLGIGAYTTKLYIGSEKIAVDVLIDTGSSTLAIDLKKYQPANDIHLTTTTFAQDVVYGQGGWAGPVIHTQIELNHNERMKLSSAPIAITSDSSQQNFQQADGIWGLAYHHLNKAYNVEQHLNTLTPTRTATYPWPFIIEDTPDGIASFKKYLRSFPEQDITPLFTAFEENQITANQFTLITHRSIEYVPNTGMSIDHISAEALNQGQLIIGSFNSSHAKRSIQVLHDAYYNVNLISFRVAGFDACLAPPLDSKHLNSFFTNAIIDSGCSFLVLQKQLYNYLTTCLDQLNPQLNNTIEQFNSAYKNNVDYQNKHFDLSLWPELYFSFSGMQQEEVELCLRPQQYWQQHAKGPDNWFFMLMPQLPQWPDQTICGLPLLNAYTCVFDRSDTANGVIHWLDKSAG